MALVISNRLSRQGRKFGLTIGSAFIVLSGLARWRGRGEVTEACFVVGGMFLLGALIGLVISAPWNERGCDCHGSYLE